MKHRKILAFDTDDNQVVIEITHRDRKAMYVRRYDAASLRRLGHVVWTLVDDNRAVMGPTLSRVGWHIREIA